MRLFLAVDLPAPVRRWLSERQAELRRSCSGWRWTRPEGIHLTLRFLGEVDERQDAVCREAWREAVRGVGPFDLHPEGWGRFPPTGRPRVLWVGIRTEPVERLAELWEALERAARSAGFPGQSRRYHPHLTLARAIGRPGLPEAGALGRGPGLTVREVVLFRSHLGPGGARYTALDRFPLRS